MDKNLPIGETQQSQSMFLDSDSDALRSRLLIKSANWVRNPHPKPRRQPSNLQCSKEGRNTIADWRVCISEPGLPADKLIGICKSVLRDSHGIAQVKVVTGRLRPFVTGEVKILSEDTGNKILRILKSNGMTSMG